MSESFVASGRASSENYSSALEKLYSLAHASMAFLGRLRKVDLIILEGKNVCPSVRPSVRTSVRPQKVSSI